MKFYPGTWTKVTVLFSISKPSIREKAIPEKALVDVPLAPAGWAMMLFSQSGLAKHHPPSLN
jgi:hypothetical protein